MCGHYFHEKRGFATADLKADKTARHYDDAYDLPLYGSPSFVIHPLLDFDEECIGVIEAVSKTPFTERQRLLLHQLSQCSAIAVRNAQVYREAIVEHDRSIGLLNVAKTLGQKQDVETTVETICKNAKQLIQADRCTFMVCDHKTAEFVILNSGETKEVRVKMADLPLPQKVVSNGGNAADAGILSIPDAYENPLFDKTTDSKAGHLSRTKAMMLVAIMSQVSSNQTLAVLQLANKREVDGTAGEFDEDEEELMAQFANYVASELEQSGFLKTVLPAAGPKKLQIPS
jgi:adenylate cyclase